MFNLASGGATIDAALVAPYLPTVLCVRLNRQTIRCSEVKLNFSSIVDQVSQFETFLASKPTGAQWTSSNSLFAFWIGINDVVSKDICLHYMSDPDLCELSGKLVRLGTRLICSVDTANNPMQR